MKKLLLKLLNCLAVGVIFLAAEPSRVADLMRLTALTIAVQQISRTSLYAPDLSSRKDVFQVASSTVPAIQIALSTSAVSSPAYVSGGLKAANATFALTDTPRKIFIPESTIASNATFVLTFDNPAADIVTQAKIFDLSGAEVVDMREETASGSNPDRLSWDGRDKSGSVVPSGIYIYQVQAGGALINGTVVVAR